MIQKGIAIVILLQLVCLSRYTQEKRPNGSDGSKHWPFNKRAQKPYAVPLMEEGVPAPGKRVRIVVKGYESSVIENNKKIIYNE